MKKCLSEYMEVHDTKKSLVQALTPKCRIINMESPIESSSFQETLSTTVMFLLRSLEYSTQTLTLVLYNGKRRNKKIRFPYYGKEPHLKSSGNNVAMLVTLLRTIVERQSKFTTSTIRDIFYSNVELYQNQRNVVYWLGIISRNYKLKSRDELNIVAAQKGLIYSTIHIPVILNINTKCSINADTIELIPYINDLTIIKLDPTNEYNVIVFEKEAIFNKIVTNSINVSTFLKNTIFVTGKGYPDHLTKRFLNRLLLCNERINVKLYVDSDPEGVCIALNYINNCTQTNNIEYKGITLVKLISKRTQLLNLTHREVVLSVNMLLKITTNPQKTLTRTDHGIVTQLQRQLFFFKKGEMNACYI
ncbi:similar to Saccharomyces cerevisiae YHL022C SPO11 Meiosis-specific protein that initiates meiotic recombination by catalyzing the formation of double-strand breaks in DNA via a transesterification reaction [Maudiozyma barnettii]|uniref:DNA topoisomerase (ATP-hydrolyzing) n=1 Tax=Maudiozyma barnettii TaxID=61262 RepID=A0A8H2VHC9_9SACH|nr:DNA topoisomerase (ATP-hydrolyzing) [Kazachstania barnettii]CAB4255298.1 similar to Saccharomyces cerevisiae YHL022C SPO11 Meiosis-specific protein that initiates meiotic recombination by catalyzing the formation of double-strand breaks in DNA via a transesterification reaction [Kazachstania barnettii]CAD1783705.1 similar to Saccharomyces cerevisiae YHL022C SPO11 Meiosis-specific protein that initiates meiotic recombination by catalyzing the formation of double-strand breaks in DNA via a trans